MPFCEFTDFYKICFWNTKLYFEKHNFCLYAQTEWLTVLYLENHLFLKKLKMIFKQRVYSNRWVSPDVFSVSRLNKLHACQVLHFISSFPFTYHICYICWKIHLLRSEPSSKYSWSSVGLILWHVSDIKISRTKHGMSYITSHATSYCGSHPRIFVMYLKALNNEKVLGSDLEWWCAPTIWTEVNGQAQMLHERQFVTWYKAH